MSESTVDLSALAAEIDWTEHEAGSRAGAALEPDLGRLAEFAKWLASVQGSAPPGSPDPARLLRFGPPSEWVAEIAAELDVGISAHGEIAESAADAVRVGIAAADREADQGTRLVILACPDSALAAAVAVAVLCDVEPVQVLARGAAASDPRAWMRRAEAVRDRRRHAIEWRDDPSGLLAELADVPFAATAGFVLQAAVRRTPVLLDGTAAAAAALVGYQVQPRVMRWLAAATTTSDPAHTLAVSTMGMRCVLDLEIGTGDGTAGLLALPILRAAAHISRAVLGGPDA